MSQPEWMIYGAAGVTGTLIAEEAARRGHQPLLVGRSEAPLAALGARLGLDWMVAGLDQPERLKQTLAGKRVALNAAGPFAATAPALSQACLAADVSYLDIAGELPVLRDLYARDRDARERGIALIGGVGFGVVATNGLVKQVAGQLPGATTLELAVKADNQQSSQGATKSVLEALAGGGRVYRDGRLTPYRLGRGLKSLRFPDGVVDILPAPTADLVAAYQATGIANITAYIPFQRAAALALPLAQAGLSIRPLRGWLEATIARRGARPRASQSGDQRTSYAWARATDPSGRQVEAWLALGEGYQFTAASSVRAVERVLRDRPTGALAPAQAFGADFTLTIEGVRLLAAAPLAPSAQER